MKYYSRKIMHTCLIVALFLCALANFYRNRDPYKAYFHQRVDHYLTTHLLDSEIRPLKCLQLRLSVISTTDFYRAIEEMYPNRQLVLPDATLFDLNRLKSATGREIRLQEGASTLTDSTAQLLLRRGKYSFLYTPLSFSPRSWNIKARRCKQYTPSRDPEAFPLLLVLLPVKAAPPLVIRAVRKGPYLFFIPSPDPVPEHDS